MLKPLLLPSAAALLVLVSMYSAANPPQSAPAKSTAKLDGAAMAKAKQVYNIDCALCHNENGDGKTDVAKGMDLTLLDWTDAKTLSGRQDQELFDIIRNGKGKMPSEATGRATDAEVKNMITYIRSFAKDQSASAPTSPAAPTAPATTNPPSPNNQ
ncbi:MAG TPA: cytochrome c [Terracidiphilus sp.]|nr:cytochrome c [Terracidiphilus sp.]